MDRLAIIDAMLCGLANNNKLAFFHCKNKLCAGSSYWLITKGRGPGGAARAYKSLEIVSKIRDNITDKRSNIYILH